MVPRPTSGFSVVELLIAVAVAGLLSVLAVPRLVDLVGARRGAAALNQMLGAVQAARTQAIFERHTVTLCPGETSGPRPHCLGRNQWHRGMLRFADHDGNGRLDGNDRLAAALPPLAEGERIYWRSFRNRSYLQFMARGFTAWQNGSLLYCPPDDRAAGARLAILNPQGRVRVGRDSDGNGVVEGANGRDVQCPP